MPKPTLSVVVPCYNAERWIGATLRSVLAQNWQGIEIVVVDDGSFDNSVRIVRDQFPEVTLIQKANGGVASARNSGIEHSRADWIAFVDADDIWLQGKLLSQWKVLEAHRDSRLSYTAWQVWPSIDPEPSDDLLNDLSARASDTSLWSGPTGWIYPDLLVDCHVWTSTVVAHRSLFEEIGIFDTTLRIGEDYDLWLRASQVTPIVRVARPLALYRAYPGSITRSAPGINYQALVVSRAIRRWGYESPNGQVARKSEVDRALARTWLDYAGMHLRAGNKALALRGALTALRFQQLQTKTWKLVVSCALEAIRSSGKR